MNRRGFLRFFGLAPIAAPAVALTSTLPKQDQSEVGRAIAVLADYFRLKRAAGDGTLIQIKFPTTPASDVIVAVGEAKWISSAHVPEQYRQSVAQVLKNMNQQIQRVSTSI